MFKQYGLDPVYYYTLPGYSWDCMMKQTGVQLDVFAPDQSDMCVMFEAGIRGGVSTIIHRYAEANNSYMKNYDPKKESIFIMYFDANNLYGWAMMEDLPTGNFKWMTSKELKNWRKFLTMDGVGCTLVVDLVYDEKLHDMHKELPLAPEKFDGKLIPHLNGRTEYVVYYKLLDQYVKLGLKFKKIHRGVSFDESPWMKPYIVGNSKLRAAALYGFDKDLFKLLNNSAFGRTCENVRNRINLKLVCDAQRLEKLASWVSFKDRLILEEDGLILCEFKKMSMCQKKPVAICWSNYFRYFKDVNVQVPLRMYSK